MSARPMHRIGAVAGSQRRFYIALSLFMVAIVFTGFWPTYFGPLLAGTVDRIPFIHVHAAVYVGWLTLFVAQTAFASAGNMRWHIRLGNIGIAYGVLIIVVGVAVSLTMFAIRVRAGEMDAAQRALMSPLVDMIIFAPIFAAAVYCRRRKPELHKRLMIVAVTTLLIAAVGRMPFLGSPPNFLLLELIFVSPILIAMAYDALTSRIVHWAYVLGAGLLAFEVWWRRDARETETWREVSVWLSQFFV